MLFALTIHRFRKSKEASRKIPDKVPVNSYIPWLFSRLYAFLKTAGIKGWRERYQRWVVRHHPGRERLVIICLGLSFCFLVASGFPFALLSSQRLYGMFLLLHVLLGSVFAVCLSLALVLRARHYTFNTENIKPSQAASASGGKSTPSRKWLKIFFWFFVASGLCLIVTALTLTLPYFSLGAQLDLFDVHRYSALVSLLSAIAFTYFSRVDDKK
jgi:cytochrome b subunit of formate dehydrogenase